MTPETQMVVARVRKVASDFAERVQSLTIPKNPAGEAKALAFIADTANFLAGELEKLQSDDPHIQAAIADARADIERLCGKAGVISVKLDAHHKRWKGALKTNRDRVDAAGDLTRDIRAYYKRGMSAGEVRLAMKRGGEELPSVRTIQRHLKKNRP